MKTLSERAKYLLSLANGSNKELARIAGVRAAAVSQWVNGPTKSLAIEPATKIGEHFGLSAMWISKGEGPMRQDQSPCTADYFNLQPAELGEPSPVSYPDTIMVSGEEKLIVLGYRKLSEGMRQIWLQAAKDAVEKEAETVVDRKKQA